MDSKSTAAGDVQVKKEYDDIKKESVENKLSADSYERSENCEELKTNLENIVVKKEFEEEPNQLDKCEIGPEFVDIKQEMDDLSEEDIDKHGYGTDMNLHKPNLSFTQPAEGKLIFFWVIPCELNQ